MDFLSVEIFSVAMFFISFYGLITSRNIVKSIIFIALMEMAVVVFFLSIGYTEGIRPPIGLPLADVAADPLPQALVITAIIIGVAVTAISLTMFITLCRQYQTTDWDVLKKKNMG